MSEEIKYCNICNYLGLDFKTGSFYCSLSHKKDKLPDVLSCEEFKTNDYIQRLKQENEEIGKLLDKTRNNRLEMYESFEKECTKYKQTLEKIRKIAKNTCKSCTSECDCIIDGEPCDYYSFYNIKELINEVLNDRD